MTGWLFILASSGAIVLVSNLPVGMEEIKKITFSSIVGANAQDVSILLWLVVIAILLIYPLLNIIVLVFTDRDYARSRHLPVNTIETVFAILLGLALGVSLKTSGAVYSFGCLIIPVLVAAKFCRTTRALFFIAPLIATLTALFGFAAGAFYNIPEAYLTVFSMCCLLPISVVGSLFHR